MSTIKPIWLSGRLHMDFVPVIYFHCDDPLCASVCPVGAISKKEDGCVVIDESACTGCSLCVYACPYGRMFYNEVSNTAGHCNLCAGRLNAGVEPSCVQHCISRELQFVTQGELRMGKACYTSSKWKLQRET